MRFVFVWNIKENEVWHIRISSFSVKEKLQKLLSWVLIQRLNAI